MFKSRKWMVLTATVMLFTLVSTVFATTPINFGTATVDGTINPNDEWDLNTDFVADMWRAGNANHPNPVVESKLYMKYGNCNQDGTMGTLYVLVLAEPGVAILTGNQYDEDHFVKVEGSKMLDNDGAGTFFFYDQNNLPANVGWEGSFDIAPGTDIEIDVHTQVYDDNESQTSALDGRSLDIDLSCPDPSAISLSSTGIGGDVNMPAILLPVLVLGLLLLSAVMVLRRRPQ